MKFLTEGLIIKEQSFGENDKIVWVLTQTHGVIRAFARGAKSLKSPKCAPTTLLTHSRMTMYKRRETYNIGDAQTLHVFARLRSDVQKMCLAQYFCELALTACPQEQPARRYLSLFLNSLYLLNEDKRSESLVKACFEMRLISISGYMPDLLMCRYCGVYAAGVMYFNPRAGTLHCSDCHTRDDGSVPLDEAALTAMRHTIFADDSKLFSFALSDGGLRQLNRATEAYWQAQYEKDFPTLHFYKTIHNTE